MTGVADYTCGTFRIASEIPLQHMTEEQWFACVDPDEIFRWEGLRLTDRSLRLFACACCREVWRLLLDDNSRQAVIASERFADKKCAVEELDKAALRAMKVEHEHGLGAAASAAAAACAAARRDSANAADGAAICSARAQMELADKDNDGAWAAMRRVQCDILRDIVGNPFSGSCYAPTLPEWNNSVIAKLAKGMYEQRRFAHMPVLADALEEAGCTETEIISHCRSPQLHVRGCWLVDIILGL
jgi:hypothetical protein